MGHAWVDRRWVAAGASMSHVGGSWVSQGWVAEADGSLAARPPLHVLFLGVTRNAERKKQLSEHVQALAQRGQEKSSRLAPLTLTSAMLYYATPNYAMLLRRTMLCCLCYTLCNTPWHATSNNVMLYCISCHDATCDAKHRVGVGLQVRYYAAVYSVMPCHVMSCHVMLYNVRQSNLVSCIFPALCNHPQTYPS